MSRKWELVSVPEDSRLFRAHTKQMKVIGFRCEECDIFLRSIILLLKHLDSEHGVHIWYERGLTRKRVFFDGILKDDLTKEERRGSITQVSGNAVPLSKRPFEPRKKDYEEEET